MYASLKNNYLNVTNIFEDTEIDWVVTIPLIYHKYNIIFDFHQIISLCLWFNRAGNEYLPTSLYIM